MTSADAANYRCVVTGACGAVTSNTAALTVLAILADDFESYADQAAFEAVWTDTANSAYYLSTTCGNPGELSWSCPARRPTRWAGTTAAWGPSTPVRPPTRW